MADSYVNWEQVKAARAMQNVPDADVPMCRCGHRASDHRTDFYWGGASPEPECRHASVQYSPIEHINVEVVCTCSGFQALSPR